MGINGSVHNWIKTFLTARKQQVVIEGMKSSAVHVDSGVPQGTVLGPLMFLCYINDLPSKVTSTVRLFADDCLIYRQISGPEDQILFQKDLDSLQQWATAWGMRFNTAKCYILRISRSTEPYEGRYTLDGQELKEVPDQQYLGVNFNSNMKFDTHIKQITTKANRSLGFLRRNLSRCPQKLKETAYFALVRATLEYSCTEWDPYLNKDIEGLEAIQRRGARFLCGDYSRESSVSGMLKELGWEDLQERRKKARLVLFHKIIHNQIAIDSDKYLKPVKRPTRKNNSQNFEQIFAQNDVFKHSYFLQTAKDWNMLPEEAVQAETLDEFRSIIRNI